MSSQAGDTGSLSFLLRFIAGRKGWGFSDAPVIASEDTAAVAVELFPGHRQTVASPAEFAEVAGRSLSAGSAILIPSWERLANRRQTDPPALDGPGFALVIQPATVLRGPRRTASRVEPSRDIAPTLVATASVGPDLPSVHPSTVLGLVVCGGPGQPLATAMVRDERSMSVSDRHRVGLLKGLLSQPGRENQLGFSLQLPQGAASWLPSDHDPASARRLAELGAFGSTLRLGDSFQVLRARMGDARAEGHQQPTGARIISGRDVTRGILEPDPEARDRRRVSLAGVDLQAGDVLLAEIERRDRPSLPIIVAAADLPLSAGNGVVVLRPVRPFSDIELRFYRAYLGSRLSREFSASSSMGAAVLLRGLSELPLPKPDPTLISALAELDAAAEQFEAWASETRLLTSELFDAGSAAEARARLLSSSLGLRQRMEAGRSIDSLDYRIGTLYPFPVAYRWRNVQRARARHTWSDLVRAALETYEVTLSLTAWLLVASYRGSAAAGEEFGPAHDILKAVRTGSRTTLGHWKDLLEKASTSKALDRFEEGSVPARLRKVLESSTAARDASNYLYALRNDESHMRGDGPDVTKVAAEAVLAKLEVLLSGFTVLSDLPLVKITRLEWDSIQHRGRAQVEQVRGDHPIHQLSEMEYRDPGLEVGSLYLHDSDGSLLLLRPFLTSGACSTCGRTSVYQPERKTPDGYELRSLDHNHVIQSDEVGHALSALLAQPGFA